MYFLDEIIKNKVTRKKVLLPLNGNDKKKGSIAFLLAPNLESSKKIISDQTLVKSKYFFSSLEIDITVFGTLVPNLFSI